MVIRKICSCKCFASKFFNFEINEVRPNEQHNLLPESSVDDIAFRANAALKRGYR